MLPPLPLLPDRIAIQSLLEAATQLQPSDVTAVLPVPPAALKDSLDGLIEGQAVVCPAWLIKKV